MPVPEPLPTGVQDESFAGVTYHVRGERVPELQIDLGDAAVMFEPRLLLWKETGVRIEARKAGNGAKRHNGLVRAAGPGRIAFSRGSTGQCVPLHLRQGEQLHVREGQLTAATDTVGNGYEPLPAAMDTFTAADGDALVWLHGRGNVFAVALADGEQLDVQEGCWLFKDPAVALELVDTDLKWGRFGAGDKLTCHRFTGPGRLGIQTLCSAEPLARE
jgi:uncharacterized protein (AIM24 family)